MSSMIELKILGRVVSECVNDSIQEHRLKIVKLQLDKTIYDKIIGYIEPKRKYNIINYIIEEYVGEQPNILYLDDKIVIGNGFFLIDR